MRKFESLGQYHDFWALVLLSAPDEFRGVNLEILDQAKELDKAFADLRGNFYLTKKNLKDERIFRIAEELLEMSYEAYINGDVKTGAHTLQECEGLIWKSLAQKTKYAVEAEIRAFGENITYANVVVSKYPYEGTQKDLGDDQATLLSIAKKYYELYLSMWRQFSFFAWVIEVDGTTKRISVDPKEDETPILGRGLKSLNACKKRLKELTTSGQIRACVLMEITAPQGDGIVRFDLEQLGLPRVSARQLFKLKKGPSHEFGTMKFHLEDPSFFPLND
ncbi:MAG: hypothetical protein JAY94_19340 [Candidatus Thiodiazotropha endolucinida]|nr:hypothetical protein [Candidatus Thiodiazotropha taylori]MCW4319674.1 hypothetical protein [Candidatus Thiodiazotropha taylori]